MHKRISASRVWCKPAVRSIICRPSGEYILMLRAGNGAAG